MQSYYQPDSTNNATGGAENHEQDTEDQFEEEAMYDGIPLPDHQPILDHQSDVRFEGNFGMLDPLFSDFVERASAGVAQGGVESHTGGSQNQGGAQAYALGYQHPTAQTDVSMGNSTLISGYGQDHGGAQVSTYAPNGENPQFPTAAHAQMTQPAPGPVYASSQEGAQFPYPPQAQIPHPAQGHHAQTVNQEVGQHIPQTQMSQPDNTILAPQPSNEFTHWSVDEYTQKPKFRSSTKTAKPYDVPDRRATVEGSVRQVPTTGAFPARTGTDTSSAHFSENQVQASAPLRPSTVIGVYHPTGMGSGRGPSFNYAGAFPEQLQRYNVQGPSGTKSFATPDIFRSSMRAVAEGQPDHRQSKKRWTVGLFMTLAYTAKIMLPPKVEQVTAEWAKILTVTISSTMTEFDGCVLPDPRKVEIQAAQSWPILVHEMVVCSEEAQNRFRAIVKKHIIGSLSREEIKALAIIALVATLDHCHCDEHDHVGSRKHFNHKCIRIFLEEHFFESETSLGFVAPFYFGGCFPKWVIGWANMSFGLSLLEWATGIHVYIPTIPYWEEHLPAYLNEIDEAANYLVAGNAIRNNGINWWNAGRKAALKRLGKGKSSRDYFPKAVYNPTA